MLDLFLEQCLSRVILGTSGVRITIKNHKLQIGLKKKQTRKQDPLIVVKEKTFDIKDKGTLKGQKRVPNGRKECI